MGDALQHDFMPRLSCREILQSRPYASWADTSKVDLRFQQPLSQNPASTQLTSSSSQRLCLDDLCGTSTDEHFVLTGSVTQVPVPSSLALAFLAGLALLYGRRWQ